MLAAKRKAGPTGVAPPAFSPPRLPDQESVDKFVASLTLGVTTGLAVVALKLSTATIQQYAYTGFLETSLNALPADLVSNPISASCVVLSIPAIGGLIVSVVNNLGGNRALKLTEVVSGDNAPISLPAQLARSAAAAVTLGTGCALGPEGPCVELGAVVAQATFETFSSTSSYRGLLVGCGAAAGVAAGFNAPIAGVRNTYLFTSSMTCACSGD